MNPTILHAVALCQTALLFFVSSPAHLRLLAALCRRRHPQWLQDRPALLRRAGALPALAWAGYTLGLACLVWQAHAIGAGDIRAGLVFGPMLAWLLFECACGLWAWHGVYKRIAPPPRRSAQLAPRTLGALVRPAAVYPALFLLALIAGLYLAAWRGGRLDGAALALALGALAAGAALWAATLAWCLRRRKQDPDDAVDTAQRRFDALQTVACLYLFDLFHLYRLAGEVWGYAALPADGLSVLASLALQAVALAAPRLRAVPVST